MALKIDDCVQKYVDEQGHIYYIVARRRGSHYEAPLKAYVRRRSGYGYVYGQLRYLAHVAYTYKYKSDAVRRAKEVYGHLLES